MVKKYGEFKCPKCDKIFFQKKLLDCHLGKHTKEETGPPKCKFCKDKLVEGKNWLPSMIKYSNRICNKCLKKRNKDSYARKKQRKMEEAKERKKNKCD